MLKNFTLALLTVLTVGNFAVAQLGLEDFAVLNDSFGIEVAVSGPTGVNRVNNSANPALGGFNADAIFDGGPEITDQTAALNSAQFIFAEEVFTELNGGLFQIEFNVTSAGNLAPASLSPTFATPDILFGIGDFVGNGLDVLPHVVTSATLASFDQNGLEIASQSVLADDGFLNDSGGFSGSFSSTLSGGSLGGLFVPVDRVAQVSLTIVGTIETVPEPSSAVLICGLGLAGTFFRRRR